MTMILNLTSLIFLISFIPISNSCSSSSRKTCNTKACESISREMLDFMDLTVDPCHDFNKFACGGFEKKNRGSYSHYLQKPNQDLRERIEKLLNGRNPSKERFETDKKVINFYEACKVFRSQLDKDQLKHNWAKYMANLLKLHIRLNLKNIGLSGWPYTSVDQLKDAFRWQDVVTKMVKFGLVYSDGLLELPLITVEVGPDDFNRDFYVLKIDSPKFEYITNEYGVYYLYTSGPSGRFVDGIKISLNDIMDITIPGEPYNEMLKRSLEIDNALEPWKSNWTHDQILGSLGHKYTRDYGNVFQLDPRMYSKSNISSLAPLICGTTSTSVPVCDPPTWIEYLNALFDASGNDNIKIRSTDTVIIKDAAYFETLNAKLKALEIQPYEMANYLGWKHVIDTFNLARNLEDDFQGNCVNYLLKGPDNVRRTENGLLNPAVGSMYIRSYFNEESKQIVEEIVTYVERATHDLLENIDWMDQTTKRKALKKLDNMKHIVGYPSELRNKTIMDSYYKNLQILDKTKLHAHPQNIRELGKFLIKTSFANMRKKWNPDSWTLETHQTVNVVNALYYPNLNEFTVPAGYLQDFTYSSEHPMYLNFGTTATTIGHEILHAFDDKGRFYDENGKKQPEPGWWSSETNSIYNHKSKCVMDQYSKLRVKQLPSKMFINGARTLGENLADIGGNKVAYNAYLQWKKDKGDKDILLNLPKTINKANKLFWIRAAQRFCATMPNEDLKEEINSEYTVHTVLGFRTNGSSMLSKEFANDFECPEGTPMNPVKRCYFWEDMI